MDYQDYFRKEVLQPFKIDEILNPKKIGNGQIENCLLSELKIQLESCFYEIKSISLQEKLTEYLQDYLVDLWSKIDNQNSKIERLQNKISKSSDFSLEWDLAQDKYILFYLKELQYFLRDWTLTKRKEINEKPIRERQAKEEFRKKIKNIKITLNKYPNIFVNASSYLIFKNYTEDIEKNKLTEFSFIYRIMIKEGLINNTIRVNVYREWLLTEFDIDLDKIKTLNAISSNHRILRFKDLYNIYKPNTSI